MSIIKAPRGTRDIWGEEIYLWHKLEEVVRLLASSFQYQEIRTPIFESTELFARGVGEATDIVQKEMYTFPDKGGRSLTLRPEGTAPVMRAYLEHGLNITNPRVKWFYMGPMFRYERPQAGRMRQFHQFGFEAIGYSQPACDAEIILIAWLVSKKLGLENLSLEINSLGCNQCREEYIKVLQDFLGKEGKNLCANCRTRAEKNPLRVLDCKEETCQEVFRSSAFPVVQDFLCGECERHQETLEEILRELDIPFSLNPYLVRGLDYYTRTAFEVKTGELGAQDAIAGGGRYDNLSSALGGPPVPGVGFAAGMERIILLMSKKYEPSSLAEQPLFYLAPLDIPGEGALLQLASSLGERAIPFYLEFADKGIKYHLRKAQKMGVGTVIMAGGEEGEKGEFIWKDMFSGEQRSMSKEELLARLGEERRSAEDS